MLRRLKGQSTLEYAMTIAVVVAGLISMQIYMKRSIEGRLRGSAEDIGEQYSAGNVTSKFTIEQVGTLKSKETFGVEGKGISKYKIITPVEIKRTAKGGDAEKITENLKDETLF